METVNNPAAYTCAPTSVLASVKVFNILFVVCCPLYLVEDNNIPRSLQPMQAKYTTKYTPNIQFIWFDSSNFLRCVQQNLKKGILYHHKS